MRKVQILALLVVVGLALALMLAITNPRAVQAQGASRLKDLIANRDASDVALTFQFGSPFLSGETLLALPDTTRGRRLAEVGEDYVCFSEPWNETRRVLCTPFTNIVSLTYLEK